MIPHLHKHGIEKKTLHVHFYSDNEVALPTLHIGYC